MRVYPNYKGFCHFFLKRDNKWTKFNAQNKIANT